MRSTTVSKVGSQTLQILDTCGLLHVGCGGDLVVGQGVVVISMATSAAADSRVTYTRGEILGRAGFSALRYVASVTIDPAILKESSAVSQSASHGDELTLSGTHIKRGERAVVDFVPDEQDAKDILAQIKTARVQRRSGCSDDP
jgi:hypothetical protein